MRRACRRALFRSLADAIRGPILERLSGEDEQTERALSDRAGVSRLAVSTHPRQLKLAGLTRDRRVGRQTPDA